MLHFKLGWKGNLHKLWSFFNEKVINVRVWSVGIFWKQAPCKAAEFVSKFLGCDLEKKHTETPPDPNLISSIVRKKMRKLIWKLTCCPLFLVSQYLHVSKPKRCQQQGKHCGYTKSNEQFLIFIMKLKWKGNQEENLVQLDFMIKAKFILRFILIEQSHLFRYLESNK